jgi:hypothetical protein
MRTKRTYAVAAIAGAAFTHICNMIDAELDENWFRIVQRFS